MKRFFSFTLAVLFVATVAAQTQQTPPPAGQAPTAQAQRPPQAPLGPNEWRIDGNHSQANFSVRHMLVSTVRGQMGKISGTVEYDGKDVKTIKADVTVDVTAISTGTEGRDRDLKSANFFDVATYPTLTFKSKRVEPGAAGHLKLIGDLTMHGVTKEVTLDVDYTQPVKTQRGITMGANATTKIIRQDFGLKYAAMIEAGPVVSDEVNISIDLELGRPSLPGTQQQ
jgi:polyisoprenoid-binding protein YceI